jgi:DnaJ family protein A protein 3
MGRQGQGAGPAGGGTRGGFGQQQSWDFHSTIDPEELFRKIFGNAGFGGRNPFGDPSSQEDFSESVYGYGAAQEVSTIIYLCILGLGTF